MNVELVMTSRCQSFSFPVNGRVLWKLESITCARYESCGRKKGRRKRKRGKCLFFISTF